MPSSGCRVADAEQQRPSGRCKAKRRINDDELRSRKALGAGVEIRHAPKKRTPGATKLGPCLTDAARWVAAGELSEHLPLCCGPNAYATIIAALLTRWKHVYLRVSKVTLKL